MDKIFCSYNPMTLKKSATVPLLLLMMFTIMCALPIAGTVPSAIAQEDDNDEDASLLDDDENLANGIVSDVVDDDGDDEQQEVNDDAADEEIVDQNDDAVIFGDSANTQTAIPLTDQNQRAADLAAQLAANLDLVFIEEEEPSTPTPTLPPPEEEPPEFTVFCVEGSIFGTACFGTLEECEEAVGLGIIGGGGCEGFESPPPGGRDCEVLRDATGQPIGVFCAP